MLLIGSRALNFWVPSFSLKEDTDWDIIIDREQASLVRPMLEDQLGKIDFLYTDDLNNLEAMTRFSSSKVMSFDGIDIPICSPHGLAILKRSHLWRDYFFDKHTTMYHKYLVSSRYDCDSEDFLRERIKLTQEYHRVRSPSLNQSNEDFFDDAVKKEYDHDTLHEMLAYYDRPLYTKLKHEGREDLAWCEKEYWDGFTYKDKCRCVAEESYVIAVERFMIPSNWKHSPRVAYRTALKKVCTTLTSGWFRDFAIDNYPKIIDLEDLTKITDMKERLQNVKRKD